MIPMIRTQSRLAFIDDDVDQLSALVLTLPARFSATFHHKPASLDMLLATSRKQLQKEQALLFELAQGQVDFDGNTVRKALRYLADPERFEAVGVLVSDYAMPLEDGVTLCKRHAGKGLQRVLLTGVADHDKAIDAFNGGAIEIYLAKHTANLRARLAAVLDEQIKASARRRGAVLEQTLPDPVLDLMGEPKVDAALHALLEKHKIVEYIFIGHPLGLLAVNESGDIVWLQLENDESLHALLDLMREEKCSDEEIARVSSKKHLMNLDMAAHLGRRDTAALAPVQVLSEHPFLGVAVFPIDSLQPDLHPASYSKWLMAQPHRNVDLT